MRAVLKPLTQVGELLEGKRAAEVKPSSSFSTQARPLLTYQSPPRTSREFRDLARRLAYDIVTGYVEHDRAHLDSAVEAFYRVYLQLFNDISPLRAHRAAELYVDVLVKQDEIENHPRHSRDQILANPNWDEVKSIFLEFSRTLGLPEAYAEETTNYYRYHGVGDRRYINHCLESDRIFTRRILGSDYWSKILGSLLLIMTECHDKHDSIGLEVGIQFATKYFEIILKEKAERPRLALASLRSLPPIGQQ